MVDIGSETSRSINDLVVRAKVACKESKYNVDDHFAVQRKMIKLAKGAIIIINLVVMHAILLLKMIIYI